MRSRMRRLSTSSLVSPGPLVPMPPPRRLIASPRPARRGSWYLSWASSTCTCASRPEAFCAKMSRITCVRSRTFSFVRRSTSRACAGVSSLSKTSRSASSWNASETASCSLPSPTSVLWSGFSRRCTVVAATVAPALRTSSASSAMRAAVPTSSGPRPTSTARSALERLTSRTPAWRASSSSRARNLESTSSPSSSHTGTGSSTIQSSVSLPLGATVARCAWPTAAPPCLAGSTSIAMRASSLLRKSVVRSVPERPPGLRCVCASLRPARRDSASPTNGGRGVSAASPTATVTTRPRLSISTLTPRPSSTVSSAMARARSAVTAASGGTRRRYRLDSRLSWWFLSPCVLP
jgi:hypothetical protein